MLQGSRATTTKGSFQTRCQIHALGQEPALVTVRFGRFSSYAETHLKTQVHTGTDAAGRCATQNRHRRVAPAPRA